MPRYPTDVLGPIPGWVVISARGSAQDQGVWQPRAALSSPASLTPSKVKQSRTLNKPL